MLEQAVYETISCHTQKLSDFWLDKSSAFNRKQKRLFSSLIITFERLWELLRTFHFVIQTNFREDISIFSQEENTLTELTTRLSEFQLQIDRIANSLNANLTGFEEFRYYLSSVSSKGYLQKQIEDLRFFSPRLEITLEKLPTENKTRIEGIIAEIIQHQSLSANE